MGLYSFYQFLTNLPADSINVLWIRKVSRLIWIFDWNPSGLQFCLFKCNCMVQLFENLILSKYVKMSIKISFKFGSLFYKFSWELKNIMNLASLIQKEVFYRSIKKYNKFTNFTIFLVPSFLTSYYVIFYK